jgi:Tfp pilus assembly protein FimT
MSGPQPSSARGGFTAIEVLIVSVVLMVFAGMAYPQVATRMAAAQADNAARAIASDLRMAIALASRQGTPMRVEFDEGALQLRILNRAGTVVHQRTFGSGSEFPVQTAEASAAVFVFPNRLASGVFIVQLSTTVRTTEVRMTRATLISVQQL